MIVDRKGGFSAKALYAVSRNQETMKRWIARLLRHDSREKVRFEERLARSRSLIEQLCQPAVPIAGVVVEGNPDRNHHDHSKALVRLLGEKPVKQRLVAGS